MTDETYNGWANRETWVVNLWLSNEQETATTARRVAEDGALHGRELAAKNDWVEDADAMARSCAADALREYVDELIADEYDKASMLTDLINGALGRVDWLEIAAAWLEE